MKIQDFQQPSAYYLHFIRLFRHFFVYLWFEMTGKDTYLNELNDSQREAVLFCDGPSLVVAGAGSGKTRVLTYKIAYLLDQGLPPYSILALTFTNKAAREMKSRIASMIDESVVNRVWMGTFHSIFYRILRNRLPYKCLAPK
jgi:DNA helicase-2/ATP-dependent DNA helicase PcrA